MEDRRSQGEDEVGRLPEQLDEIASKVSKGSEKHTSYYVYGD